MDDKNHSFNFEEFFNKVLSSLPLSKQSKVEALKRSKVKQKNRFIEK